MQHLLHDHSNEGIDPTRTTFIHVLRWDTPDHTKIMFQKWYLYDPTRSNRYFYLQSEQQVLQRTAIPGQQDFQFIYIHFNNDLSVAGEWRNTNYENDPSKGILAHPVSYTITVTKQQTQFVQDLRTLLPLVVPEAGLLPSAVSPEIGYFSVATFHSQWHTSTIQITATTDTAQQTAQGSSSKDATPTPAISNTYHNERPSWIGLSAGIPVTSYKDVTYDQSSGTLQPKSITKQSAYVFLDGYLPPVLPSLTTLRWLPHPFYGLPMTGEVFRHQMFGLGVSLGWIEPFWGVIRDTQNKEIVGINKTNVTWKGSFGIKISISALSKAVKK